MTDPVYGNFRGKVVDTNDPEKKGRIKVEIYPYFHNIEAKYLPWCIPATPLFCGAGSGVGSFTIPEVNSLVWCFFEAGDIYQPVYFAEAPDFIHGIGEEKETNYPQSKVWKTSSGFLVVIDDSVPSITISYVGGVGVVISGQDNSVVITQPNGTSMQLSGDGTINISGSGVVNVSGTEVNINTV